MIEGNNADAFSFKNISIFCISCSEWNVCICPCGSVCAHKPVMNINHQVELTTVKWAVYFSVDFRIWVMCLLSFSASLCLSDKNLKNLSAAYITSHKSRKSCACTILETCEAFLLREKCVLLALRSRSAELS